MSGEEQAHAFTCTSTAAACIHFAPPPPAANPAPAPAAVPEGKARLAASLFGGDAGGSRHGMGVRRSPAKPAPASPSPAPDLLGGGGDPFTALEGLAMPAPGTVPAAATPPRPGGVDLAGLYSSASAAAAASPFGSAPSAPSPLCARTVAPGVDLLGGDGAVAQPGGDLLGGFGGGTPPPPPAGGDALAGLFGGVSLTAPPAMHVPAAGSSGMRTGSGPAPPKKDPFAGLL